MNLLFKLFFTGITAAALAAPTAALAKSSLEASGKANKWTKFVSEGASQICAEGVVGMKTRDAWGGAHSLLCGPKVAVDLDLWEYGENWFSDEYPNRSKCPDNYILVGISCKGRHCDNVLLTCAKVATGYKVTTSARYDGYGGERQSEEPNNNKHVFNFLWPLTRKHDPDSSLVLTGLGCEYNYCDTLMFRNSTLYPDVDNPSEPSKYTMGGGWEMVKSCSGSQCGTPSISVQLETGVTSGKEVSTSTTVGRALSVMVGGEVKTSTGALPGGEATAKFEVTGNWSNDRTNAVAKSFSISKAKTETANCDGQAALWQWVTTFKVHRVERDEVIIANSSLTVCAKIGEEPEELTDISWTP